MKHVLKKGFLGLFIASSLLTGCFSGENQPPSIEKQPQPQPQPQPQTQTQTQEPKNKGRALPPPVAYPPVFYPYPVPPVVIYPPVFYPQVVFFPLEPASVYFSGPSTGRNEHHIDERTILAEIEEGLNFALTTYYRNLFPKNRTSYYGVEGGYEAYEAWYLQTGIARRVHGTAHATRAVLWSQLFAGVLESAGQKITEAQRIGAGLAAAFHDSGRQDDGVDPWDLLSASQLISYLDTTSSQSRLDSQTLYLAIRYKDNARSAGYSVEQALLNASDTVEIMRTSKARLHQGFRENALHLPSQISSDLKLSLLLEIQDFIDLTEDEGVKLHLENSPTPYRDLLHTIDHNASQFPTLYRFLAGQIAAI